MVLALEPMVNAGGPEIRVARTTGRSTGRRLAAAHFEFTVAVTEDGPRV